jgi:CubicO group peptidase (beta-lactamase class C family)
MGNKVMNERIRRAAAALGSLTLLLALPAPLAAQGTPAIAGNPNLERYGAAIEQARMLMREVKSRSGAPGWSVAVGHGGEVVWAEGYGFADLELGVPVSTLTRFRIGSVSKPLTAAAVGQLIEQGRLDLDAPVQRYVPSFPEKRWPVTTRTAAGHLAGIRHYDGDEFMSAERFETVQAGLEIFQDDTLLFQPGTRFSYSSYAWNLVSAVVEGASGEKFLSYMQDHVFGPLEMENTVADHTDSIVPNRSRFYMTTPDGVLNAPFVDNSYKWAGGGFLSTPSDLVQFGMAHFGEELMRRGTIDELWTSQRTNEGEETENGIGWFFDVDPNGARVVQHGGGSIGGTTMLMLMPERDIVVAMVANARAATSAGLAWTLAQFFLTEPGVAPTAQPSVAGTFDCSISRGGEQVAAGELMLEGGPGDYWGRIAFEEEEGQDVREIVMVAGGPDELHLILVGGGGNVLNLWLSPDGEGVGGRWMGSSNTGELACTPAAE